jgi:hypothetical protein
MDDAPECNKTTHEQYTLPRVILPSANGKQAGS